MATALELGLSVDDFWAMSPRAIGLLRDERERRMGAKPDKPKPQLKRLNYLPRP